jgi:formamidopyrimidine-DNA glycosylase
MIELPEAITLGRQMSETLVGKTVTDVFPATSVNKFVFFNGDPLAYKSLLIGRKILSAKGMGIFVDICFDNDVTLSISDGIKPQYDTGTSSIPQKYQLLLTFDDETFLAFNVAMYGGIYAFKGKLENRYHEISFNKISPLSNEFTRDYFENYLNGEKGNLSLKAFLATEQRFPGIGNGVLQDILFDAGLHPKRKLNSLISNEKDDLCKSIVKILSDMLAKGGRDTDTDLFGSKGGYKTILSKNTYKQPCPKCGGEIKKESYMGGSIYYCPVCQSLV